MPLPAIRNASNVPAGANPHQNSQLDMAGLTGTGDLGENQHRNGTPADFVIPRRVKKSNDSWSLSALSETMDRL
jgi:hypothetical protein